MEVPQGIAALITETTVLKRSTTTSDGNVAGTTLIDSALTEATDDYWSGTVVILSGACKGQKRDIASFTALTDTITVGSAFASQIVSGVEYAIVAFEPATVEVAALQADVGDASASTLLSLYGILGNPSASLATTILDGIDARTNNPTLHGLLNFPDTAGYTLYDSLIGNVNEVNRVTGKTQILEVSVTSAANTGNVTVGTITTQPCLIKSIVLHADATQTTDLTSAAIYGGAGNVITFISAVDAVQANLDAADKQISWIGAVRLAAGKTIIIDLQGTGATAVDLTVTIEYEASVNGGYLS